MPSVTIYSLVDNPTPMTRNEWASALTALQAHPILSAIDSYATQVANQVSLTVLSATSTRYALLSFILPEAIRPNLQGYAMQSLGVGAITDPVTQYGTVFTTIARTVLPDVTITVIGYDEDTQVAVEAHHAYILAHPEQFPVTERPRGGL